MKRVNTEIIGKFNPCADRFDNWKKEYGIKNITIKQFLKLTKITHADKLWVACRLLNRESLEVFALDCAFSAQQHAAMVGGQFVVDYYAGTSAAYAADSAAYAADSAAYAADSAAYAADSAAYAAAYAANLKEQESQLEVLNYLFDEEKSCEVSL